MAMDFGADSLPEILSFDWSNDHALRRFAEEAYTGSVRRWKQAIKRVPAIMDAWRAFERQAARRRILAFLAEHGIEPIENRDD